MRRRQVIKSVGALSLGLPFLADQDEEDEDDSAENETQENDTVMLDWSGPALVGNPGLEDDEPEDDERNQRYFVRFRRVEEPRETARIVDAEENNITQLPALGGKPVGEPFELVLGEEEFSQLAERISPGSPPLEKYKNNSLDPESDNYLEMVRRPTLAPHGLGLDYYDLFLGLEDGFVKVLGVDVRELDDGDGLGTVDAERLTEGTDYELGDELWKYELEQDGRLEDLDLDDEDRE